MRELIGFAIGLVAGFIMGRIAMPAPKQHARLAQQHLSVEPPTAPKLPEPILHYDSTPIETIRQNLRGLSLAEREAVRVYEAATLKRRGILSVLKALGEERVNGNA